MAIYITNITDNIEISVRSISLKPGKGHEFDDEIAEQPGVVAYVKKGWLKTEMVKKVPVEVPVSKIDTDTSVSNVSNEVVVPDIPATIETATDTSVSSEKRSSKKGTTRQ